MRSCLWTTLMNLFDPLQILTTIYIYIMIFPPKNKNSLTKSPKICSLLYHPWNNMTSCICVHLMLKLFGIASVFCYFNSLQGILSLNSYQCLLFLLFNMLLNVFIFCNKFTCFLYEMQIVMITPREDKQNISSIVSLCYLSPNITPAQLFNARSSLYNARSDVLFNESISISASQCWSLSTANIWLSECHSWVIVQMSEIWNAFCTVDFLQLRGNCQVGKHGKWPKCTVACGVIRVHWTAFLFLFI